MKKEDIYYQQILKNWFNCKIIYDLLFVFLSIIQIVGLIVLNQYSSKFGMLILSYCVMNIILIFFYNSAYLESIYLENTEKAKYVEKKLSFLDKIKNISFSLGTICSIYAVELYLKLA